MSLSQTRHGRWARLKNWWTSVPKEIEDDAKTKWYMSVDRSIVASKRRAEFSDYLKYINNPYMPAAYRMHALNQLIGNNATSSGPKDDPNLAELLLIWNQLVGLFWMPLVRLKQHREEEAYGVRNPGNEDAVRMPLSQIETMLSTVADKHFIPRGVTLVELMYGESDHVPEFTHVREMPPAMGAAMGGGQDPELKAALAAAYARSQAEGSGS